ncbi:hypothetical protein Q5M85_21305 [Paraclostridium bifermentans]|nr:hypothetical protein [Paraclostridium bifermentans]
MDKVAAISGATGSDLGATTLKAEEMVLKLSLVSSVKLDTSDGIIWQWLDGKQGIC